jgi:hypothetical protein
MLYKTFQRYLLCYRTWKANVVSIHLGSRNSRIVTCVSYTKGAYSLCNLLETPHGSFAAAEHASYYREIVNNMGKEVKAESRKL